MLFSIGVTTYDRNERLKTCLESLLRQTYADFEILVGNDYVQKPIELSSLGIADRRIKLFNYEGNLGELGNMNRLLSLASGEYFTILSDDDLFALNCLEIICVAISRFNGPNAVFFPLRRIYGDSKDDSVENRYEYMTFKGSDFFDYMLDKKLLIMGESCFYRTDYLRRSGGFVRISDCKVAFYAEYFLIAMAVAEEKLAFINAPLLHYRDYPGSWSAAGHCKDVDMYNKAGANLVSNIAQILKGKVDDRTGEKVMCWAMRIHLGNLIAASYRSGICDLFRTMLHMAKPTCFADSIYSLCASRFYALRMELFISRLLPYIILSCIGMTNRDLSDFIYRRIRRS